MTRIAILGCAAILAAGVGYTTVAGQKSTAASSPTVTVYKSPT